MQRPNEEMDVYYIPPNFPNEWSAVWRHDSSAQCN